MLITGPVSTVTVHYFSWKVLALKHSKDNDCACTAVLAFIAWCTIRPQKKKKKKICFTEGQTCQIGRIVNLVFFCFFFFNFWWPKITLKTQKFQQISYIFCRKIWENILTCFQKFSAKSFRFWSKNGWFYKILGKKNLTKQKIWVTCTKGFFFFFFFFTFFLWPKPETVCKSQKKKKIIYIPLFVC